MTEQQSTPSAGKRSGGAHFVLLALVFLIPFFFIPSARFGLPFTKVITFYIALIACFYVWIFVRLRAGKISIFKNYVFIPLALIPIITGLAALFSPARSVSFFGLGIETDTFFFVFALVVLTFLTTAVFASKKAMLYAYLAFIASFIIVALFQFIRLVGGPGVLSLHTFTSQTASMLGDWNDLGIFCGLAAVLSFLTLELLTLEKWMKCVLIAILVVALFFLSVVNFSLIWYVLGGIALIFFVYNFTFSRSKLAQGGREGSRSSAPVLPFVLIVVAFIFILIKGNIYSTLGSGPKALSFFNNFSVTNVEVRPSWISTWDIVKPTLAHRAILGVGPNRFVNQWVAHKPSSINTTVFWSTDFNFGIGYIPTTIVTTGILGFLAWIAFLASFLYTGFKALFRKTDSFSHYLSVSSFVVALYLWIFVFFYVPSSVILILTFFFTGLFFASLLEDGYFSLIEFDFIKDPRVSFFSVLTFIVLLLAALFFGYNGMEKFIGSVYYNQGQVLANTSGATVDSIESSINKAISLNANDTYYRALSSLNLSKLSALVANQNSLTSDELKSQFQSYLSTAVAASQAAVAYDKTDYLNWLASGSIYDSLMPLGNADAYTQAKADYAQAAVLDPTDPSIQLDLANLEFENKNDAGAKQYITNALQLKNNYTDAVFLLAQIQASEGDLASAIQSVEASTLISPNDPTIYFQLGVLRYDNKDYSGAASAFNQALTLSPSYANAMYFLGLSDYYLGDTKDALAEFQALLKSNPGNQTIQTVLANLEAGKDPLAGLNQQSSSNASSDKLATPPATGDTTTTQ